METSAAQGSVEITREHLEDRRQFKKLFAESQVRLIILTQCAQTYGQPKMQRDIWMRNFQWHHTCGL
eukprot:m.267368 g.267368  ORF g.267368 m.267368 type:complete len:67 (+) comp40512_c0_seq4:145-345(+)